MMLLSMNGKKGGGDTQLQVEGCGLAGGIALPYMKVVGNFCLIDPHFWHLLILLGFFFKSS